jgi:radical SAM protein with 4Fe4S-binding SPASM domain
MLFRPCKVFGLRELYRAKPEAPDADIVTRYADIKTIPDFPQCLHVEVTSFCDNKCVFCTRPHLTRQLMHMPFPLYKKIIDECSANKKVSTINLFKDGDPILAPDIAWMIRYAKEKQAAEKIVIATSGNALNKELSREIILSGLDDICFSLDALTEAQYKTIKGTENYGRVLANIFDFIKIRDALGSPTPSITVKALATHDIADDLDLFVRMWINLADYVLIDREFNAWDGTSQEINEQFKDVIEATYKTTAPRYPCNRPWYMASIYADGKVTVCPEDWAQRMILGDLNSESLYDIWHGDKLHAVKRKHIENDYADLEACRHCQGHILRNCGDWFVKNKDLALARRQRGAP